MPIGLTQQLRSAVPSSIHSTSSGGTLPPQCGHLVGNLRIALGSAPPRSGLVALEHCAEPRSQFICLVWPGLARAIRPRNRFLRDPGFSSAASETGSKALPAQGIPPLRSLSGKRSGSGCQREEQRSTGASRPELRLGRCSQKPWRRLSTFPDPSGDALLPASVSALPPAELPQPRDRDLHASSSQIGGPPQPSSSAADSPSSGVEASSAAAASICPPFSGSITGRAKMRNPVWATMRSVGRNRSAMGL